MDSSPEQLLSQIWMTCQGREHAFAMAFYDRLFASYPRYEQMFRATPEVRRQRMLETLTLMLAICREPEIARRHLKEIGRQHRGYQLDDADLEIFKCVFIDELARFLERDWSEQEARHWHELFDTMIFPAMIEGLDA